MRARRVRKKAASASLRSLSSISSASYPASFNHTIIKRWLYDQLMPILAKRKSKVKEEAIVLVEKGAAHTSLKSGTAVKKKNKMEIEKEIDYEYYSRNCC